MPLFRNKRKTFFTKQRNNYFFNTFYNYEFICYIYPQFTRQHSIVASKTLPLHANRMKNEQNLF